MADFVSGDIGSKLLISCRRRNGNPFDLTNWTLKIKFRIGQTSFTKTCTILDAAQGEAEYTYVAGELLEGMKYTEVQAEHGDGRIISSQNIAVIPVRGKVL